MLTPVQEQLRRRVTDAACRIFELSPDELPPFRVETPPSRALGDLAVPLAFELARRLRQAPRQIAQQLVGALGAIEGVTQITAAPNGYLNVFLDRGRFLRDLLSPAGPASRPPTSDGKTIVEHTAINPNKAAHIGHIRNAVLGDTLGRLLRFRGLPVEIQNYIDDTGVQVADVVVGFTALEDKTLEQVRETADTTRFDFYCWDLYARVTAWYAEDPARATLRAATLHDIEHGRPPAAELASFIADRIVRCHLRTMARLNIDYDLITWESDILRLEFWAQAFEILKRDGAVYLQPEGRHAGCWVMRLDDDPGPAEPSETDAATGETDEDRREKVIVRSNGVVTYVGKDIAYQLWKFGLLGRDFYYRPFGRKMDGATLWSTTSRPVEAGDRRPGFGRARQVFNVIDTRQAYLQKLVTQALAALGHTAEAASSVHFAYEMVALSHATARALGFETGEDAGRPFVEVSGRKGLGVKADDLIDRLHASAVREVAARNPDLPEPSQHDIAEAIAIAAVRYFMIKYSRAKVIAFDIEEALSFEGETGPYLQYAVVRANNIDAKLRERYAQSLDDLAATLPGDAETPLAAGRGGDDLWNLVLESARLDEIVEQAVRTQEPAVLAKYAFTLAQRFNAFYHKSPILNEEDPGVRAWRAAVVALFRRQMTTSLDLMGCRVPSRM